jgi:hypothetical protein
MSSRIVEEFCDKNVARIAVMTTITIIASSLLLRNVFQRQCGSIKFNDNETKENLTKVEKTTMMMVFPISTLTFYEGELPLEYLRQKISRIMSLNPWLAGCLKSSASESVYLSYPTILDSDRILDDYLYIINAPDLTESSYNMMLETCKQYSLNIGHKCLDKNEKLTRWVLFRINDHKFAIMFTVSHVIADGFTYYALYSMLDVNTLVKSMIVKRNMNFMRYVIEYLGIQQAQFGHQLPTLLSLILSTIFRSIKVFRPSLPVSSTLIEHIKDSYKNSVKTGNQSNLPSFISTNDILTSICFNLNDYGVPVMMMNLRNRVPDLTNDMAGNYEVGLFYGKKKYYDTPAAIRKSIETLYFGEPSQWKILTEGVNCVTNWTSFYKQIFIDDNGKCHHLTNVPIIRIEEMTICRSFCFIYYSSAKNICLATYNADPTTFLVDASSGDDK